MADAALGTAGEQREDQEEEGWGKTLHRSATGRARGMLAQDDGGLTREAIFRKLGWEGKGGR